MDMTAFLPRECHTAFRVLGKCNWLHVDNTGKGTYGESIDRAVVNEVLGRLSGPDRFSLAEMLGRQRRWEPTLVLSKLLADGPKCFRPTFAQCEAMENVALEITLADYQQPYPAIVIVFPHEYAVSRNIPQSIALYHNASDGYCFMFSGKLATVTDGQVPVFQSMSLTADGETMEQKLNRMGSDDCPERGLEELERTTFAQRVALNCNMLLTQHRTRLIDPDPKYAAKLLAMASSKNKEKAERARRFQAGEFKVVEFEQEIQFFGEEGMPGDHVGGPPTGRSVRPHWRKGHWRRQACGIAWSEHRLIFLKPVLVRRDRFAGELSSTSVAYVGAARTQDAGPTVVAINPAHPKAAG